MAIDLKLVEWIRANQRRYSRTQVVEMLKKEGNTEQDITDSYEEVVKRSDSVTGFIANGSKSMAATVILSIFIPGAGHMYTGAVGKGITILILYFVGVVTSFLLIGIPLVIGMWIWGLAGSVQRCDKINKGIIQA